MSGVGWGAEPWGGGPWGSNDAAALTVYSVVAIAENLVRVTFSQPVYWSGLGDFPDALQPKLWTISPIAGSVGLDGTPARAVAVASVAVPELPGIIQGTAVDLTLDRAMTPWNAAYTLTVDPRVSTADLSESVSPPLSFNFAGLFREVAQPDSAAAQPANDLAMPNTLAAAVAAGLADPAGALGTIPVDDSGDYADVSGLPSLKERVYRRLFTKPGGFLHLGNDYGVGVTDYLKKLALASTQQTLAAKIEQQVSREPEVARAVCRLTETSAGSGAWVVRLLLQLKSGQRAAFDVPLPRLAA